MRRRKKNERNSLLDKALVGPLEGARLWGYRSGRSFKRKLPELRRIGEIRTVHKLKGIYYLLEDLMKLRHPQASDKEIEVMVKEYQERKIKERARGNHRNQWIEPKQATMILGLPFEAALEASVGKSPRIRKVQRQGHICYNLRDCFRRIFQEADDEELDQLIIAYKENQLERRSKQDENSQEG